MATERPTPTRSEREFKIEELFFSTTDKKGVIRAGNDVFARVSGYQFSELIGQPHNIIRHPDMPRAVFKLLWDYLDAGRSIVAYVKNMAKDGSFYWVVAVVTPIEDGYLSIRFKPSSPIFGIVQDVYKQLLAIEDEFGSRGEGRKAGMEAATNKLLEILKGQGFRSYDAFMHTVLREELKSREALIKQASASKVAANEAQLNSESVETSSAGLIVQRCAKTSSVLNQLFERLDDFVHLNSKLEGKADFVSDLAGSMLMLSLNACVESTRLGDEGATLSVLAGWLGDTSNRIIREVEELRKQLLSIIDTAEAVVYDIAAAKLQLEMLWHFASELCHKIENGNQAGVEANPASTEALVATLMGSFGQTSERALQLLMQMNQNLGTLYTSGDELFKILQALQFVHLNGQVETARLARYSGFATILEDVSANIQSSKAQLNELTESITFMQERLSGVDRINAKLAHSVQSLSESAQSAGR